MPSYVQTNLDYEISRILDKSINEVTEEDRKNYTEQALQEKPQLRIYHLLEKSGLQYLDDFTQVHENTDIYDHMGVQPDNTWWYKFFKAITLTLSTPLGWAIFNSNRHQIIAEDEIGLEHCGGEYRWLRPGRYLFMDPRREFLGRQKINNNHISHNNFLRGNEQTPKHKVVIRPGYVGLVFDQKQGEYYLLSPGQHYWNNVNYVFMGETSSEKPHVPLGQTALLTVRKGEVAVTYNYGKLEIKEEGIHVLKSINHKFAEMISKEPQTHVLNKATSNAQSSSTSLSNDPLEIVTADNVKLELGLTVAFELNDPEKAAQQFRGERDSKGESIQQRILHYITDQARLRARNCVKNCSVSEDGVDLFPTQQDIEMLRQNGYNVGKYGYTKDNDERKDDTSNQSVSQEKLNRIWAKVQEKEQLRQDIEGYGIKLLSIGTQGVKMNNDIQQKMLQDANRHFDARQTEKNAEAESIATRTKADARLYEKQKEAEGQYIQQQKQADAKLYEANKTLEAAQKLNIDPSDLEYWNQTNKLAQGMFSQGNNAIFFGANGGGQQNMAHIRETLMAKNQLTQIGNRRSQKLNLDNSLKLDDEDQTHTYEGPNSF